MNKIRLAAAAVALSAAFVFYSHNFSFDAQIRKCFAADSEKEQIIVECTSLLEHLDLTEPVRARALFRRAFVSAKQNPESAKVDYLEVLTIRPDWTWPLNNLGLVYLDMNEPAKALPYFTRVLEIEPDAHHRRGNRAKAYFEMDRFEEALTDSKIVLASEPNNVGVLYLQGRSFEGLGQYEAALETYSQIILINSNDQRARLRRAWLYLRDLNLPRHAEVDARHVLSNTPDNPYASSLLGAVLVRLDRYPEAVEAYEHALANKPDYSYAHRGLERVERKIAEQQESNKRLSSPLGRELSPQGFGNLLARSFADLGDSARALAEYDAVLAQQPNNALTHAGKAKVYHGLGNYEAAIASLADFFDAVSRQAEGAKLSNAVIDQQHTQLGNSYHRLGNADAALAEWKRGLAAAHAKDVSLWQLRLESAGHFSGWPDGKISPAFLDGLAACSSDLGCLNETLHASQ